MSTSRRVPRSLLSFLIVMTPLACHPPGEEGPPHTGGGPVVTPPDTAGPPPVGGPPAGDVHADFPASLVLGQMVRPIAKQRQSDLLLARYDLGDKPSADKMTRGKPVQEGIRARLKEGVTWELLGSLRADEIKTRDWFPEGFMPL